MPSQIVVIDWVPSVMMSSAAFVVQMGLNSQYYFAIARRKAE